jgi:hypothetical protein
MESVLWAGSLTKRVWMRVRNNSTAFLEGDKGGKMRCKFRLSDTVVGYKGGGYGLCETADGRVIDMFPR